MSDTKNEMKTVTPPVGDLQPGYACPAQDGKQPHDHMLQHDATPARKRVHIIGGGTVNHIRPHLALSAVAYGATARTLERLCREESNALDVRLHLTRMVTGGKGYLETPRDIERLIDRLIEQHATKLIFFTPAIVDFSACVLEHWEPTPSGKDQPRLGSLDSEGGLQSSYRLELVPDEKIIQKIRKTRKDIFLVGFKTTAGATLDAQYVAGLHLLKRASCSLVLANDVRTRMNMVITPEEARYHVTANRLHALKGLVEMAYLRSQLSFTRSTVVAGEPVSWHSDLVPQSLRAVVDYCIGRGAYKPFRGSTVGHFAVKINDTTSLTSRRKTDFNELERIGLVRIESAGPDSIIAYGCRPSVGGQSQRIIFADHPQYDCIVHFHCPKKENSAVPTVSQREYECGSHECGRNTSRGLEKFGNLCAVYLDNHGPNVVFNRSIDPAEVITFIEQNFELAAKTGGYVQL